MYPVTQTYRDSMAGQIRGAVTAEGELLNVDAYVQGGMTVTSADALSGCNIAEISDPTADKLQDVATFEQDYLRTDGSQVFMDSYTPDYYISSSLSAATPNAGRVYPITAAVSAAISADWSFGAQPVTIVFDEAVAHVSVTLYYMEGNTQTSFTASHPVENGIVVIPQLMTVTRYTGLTVSVTSLNRPNRRARIKKIYAGTRRLLTGNEIISLKYSDENDGVGLELPSKTVSLSIDNLGHQYTMETEYESPSFHPLHTQLIFRVGYDVYGTGGAWEWVPFPKMYLSSYQVNDETVDFTFEDAIGRINEDDSVHYYALPVTANNWQESSTNFLDRVSEVMRVTPDYTIYDGVRNIPVQTPPQRLGMSLRTDNARNIDIHVPNPCPPVKSAQALQLYGSLTGNLLRSRRTGDTLELFNTTISPISHISADEQFSYPKWSREKTVSSVDVETYELRDDGELFTPVVDIDLLPGKMTSIDSEQPIIMTTVYYNSANPASSPSYFAYRDYQPLGETSTGLITWVHHFSVYSIIKEVVPGVASTDNGDLLKLSNPLCNKTLANSFAQLTFNELKHNMSADLSHRGFPELDAGDVITFETENRTSVTGRVVKNEFEIKAGSMSGSTKVRRLS